MFTTFNYSSVQTYTGILDTLNNVSDCQYTFSPYKRLTGSYSGDMIDIKRTSDNATDTITTSDYDSSGDINSSEIQTWSQGGDVLVTRVYSEVNSSSAYQTTDDANKPKIVEGGSFLSDGLKFDGTNDCLEIIDYAEIQITEPPLTTYTNNTVSNQITYVFCKNNDTFTNITFAYLVSNAGGGSLRQIIDSNTITEISSSGTTKSICTWRDKNASGALQKVDSTEDTGTQADSLTNYPNINIGCRSDAVDNSTKAGFYLGNIKTILIFNSDEYANYAALVAAGI